MKKATSKSPEMGSNDVTVERIEGADHSFVRGPEDKEGIRNVFANVVNWFLSAGEKH